LVEAAKPTLNPPPDTDPFCADDNGFWNQLNIKRSAVGLQFLCPETNVCICLASDICVGDVQLMSYIVTVQSVCMIWMKKMRAGELLAEVLRASTTVPVTVTSNTLCLPQGEIQSSAAVWKLPEQEWSTINHTELWGLVDVLTHKLCPCLPANPCMDSHMVYIAAAQ
jgi:hypothetical protein